jgi:hypothetical protein
MREGEYRELLIERHASRLAQQRRGGGPSRQGDPMGAIFNVFPLILVPMLIYNLMAFSSGMGGGGGEAEFRAGLDAVWFSIPMASQEKVNGVMQTVEWKVTTGAFLVFISMVLLFIELIKSTSTGTSAIFNHALSMVVFIVALIEFLLHPAFATTTFFLIMVMALLDVIAGVVVTIISARRDVDFGGGGR